MNVTHSAWQLLRYVCEELWVVLDTSSSEPILPRLLMKLACPCQPEMALEDAELPKAARPARGSAGATSRKGDAASTSAIVNITR